MGTHTHGGQKREEGYAILWIVGLFISETSQFKIRHTFQLKILSIIFLKNKYKINYFE